MLALFNGFNFFQMPASPPHVGDLNLRRGMTFVSLIAMTINNLVQLPAYLAERQVYHKQASALFFRPSSFLLAHLLAELPIYFLEVRLRSPTARMAGSRVLCCEGEAVLLFLFMLPYCLL